jgi:hypothetical protein
MAPEGKLEIRPRTTGEILDDAGRLALADAPVLLALSGLFNVPFAIALVALLAWPRPAAILAQLLPPALTALLLPLTGLGSGACQEAFRRRAEGKPVGLGTCLGGVLRRGLDHATARALKVPALLFAGILGILGFAALWQSSPLAATAALAILGLPVVVVLAGSAAVHPILAAKELRLFEAAGASIRESSRQSGKAAALALCRCVLLLMATLNLLALTEAVLWVAGNLAGLDTALVNQLLSLDNPVFMLALLLLAWVLLTPFVEASNYLCHADARARYEGLDLWYRVQQFFPVAEKGRAVALALAAGAGLVLAGRCAAADGGRQQRVEAVRQARIAVDAVRQEVAQANPYPGGGRWAPRLKDTAQELDPQGSTSRGPYRWFYQAIDGFEQRSREGAAQVLGSLSSRLAAAEESLAAPAAEPSGGPAESGPPLSKEEIKRLLPEQSADPGAGGPQHKPTKADRQEDKRPTVRRDNEEPEGGGEPGVKGPGLVGPPAAGGFGLVGLVVLGGVLLAIVAVACVLLVQQRLQAGPALLPAQAGKAGPPGLADLLTQPDSISAAELWRRADRLAGAGEHLEAVRTLYAAVLATLNRRGLIRYEPMRTNGEYAAQLRASGQAPEEVHEPFGRLTRLFEQKWYGERACRAEDYDTCRELAEEVRSMV